MRRISLAVLTSLMLFGCGQASPLANGSASSFAARASEPLDPKFFARQEVLALSPDAFSPMPHALPMLSALQQESEPKRHAFIRALLSEPGLAENLRNFGSLSWEQKEPLLERVFDLECRTLDITPPELVFDATMKGAAYFDFDPARPGAGRVLLNPAELDKETNPHAALLLLIHETRHSAQFQMAFDARRADTFPAKGYRAAFDTQKRLSKQLNFSEFCSLHNEYEAFQFANYVVGSLTGWKVETLDMGCFSSQYDAHGKLRIDLLALARSMPGDGLLTAFNDGQKAQYRLLVAKP